MEKKRFSIEKIVHWVERVAQNRMIIALLLVVDGILFLMNPEEPVENMGRTLAITMVFAAAVMIFARIVAKDRFRRFIPALILLAVGGVMYFFPQALSAYFRLILALAIMMTGIVNLLDILGVNYKQGTMGNVEGKVRNVVSKVKTTKELDEGFDEQALRYVRPLNQVVSATKGHRTIFFITSLLSVLLGALLLIKPDLSITIFGVIFVYVGISDFLLAYRAGKISQKLREKKYREILFDGTEKQENGAVPVVVKYGEKDDPDSGSEGSESAKGMGKK